MIGRKKLLSGLGVLCLALLMAPLSFAAGGPPVKPPPKAKTMAELAERYSPDSCIECHEEAFNQWQNSLHAKSILGTPRTAPTILTAIDKGLKRFPFSGVSKDEDITVEKLMFCAKCHLPQLDEATDDVAREIVSTIRAWKKAANDIGKAYDEGKDDLAWDLEDKMYDLQDKIASLNIGCNVCHNKLALIHKWADGYPQPDTVYGAKKGDHYHPEFNKMAEAPALDESIFCGQCHGEGPNFELDHPSQCATLYGSYLFAYIPDGGTETCQECHMEKSGLGHDMQAYRNEKMLDMALDVEVESTSYFWRKNKEEGIIPMALIKLGMTNKTGHVVPDG